MAQAIDASKCAVVGYARVPLDSGASAEVHATFPAGLAAYTGADGRRVGEPEPSHRALPRPAPTSTTPLTLTEPVREVGHGRRMRCELHMK
ncbi:hypothetical protein [Streptomyces sp. NBC_00063]|uniref:hypothetical protein n=1 Tax=Streptomyces sp. NBC_00063 TaxID=2975638 RepID=UPI003D758C3E